MSGGKFNPADHLRNLGRGRGEYLEVKWRLVWLRQEHPDAVIETRLIETDNTHTIFQADVTLPSGGRATGHKQETAADFGDHLEKAETGSIGRALAALGFGTQFIGEEMDEGARIVDSGAERAPRTAPATTTANRAQPQYSTPPATPHAQPPTEAMLKFARALQGETNLSDEELGDWLMELQFGVRTLGELNMAQTSMVINQLQRRKASRA